MAESEARVSILDRGFLYGDGCFETVRMHRGAPFRFDAHLRRLDESLKILDLERPAHLGRVREDARELAEAWRMQEGLIRITVTPPNPDAKLAGTVAITARGLPPVPERVTLRIAQSVRRVPGPLSRTKPISRVAEAVALREARRGRAFDAVLLNSRGNVVETTARNLFLVTGGGILTPPASEGALEGVTRAVVIELALKFGLPIRETSVSTESLLAADEVFLTGSGVGVLGVATVHAHDYGPVPGPVTKRLADAYGKVLDDEAKW